VKYTVSLAGRTFEVDLSGPTARVDGEAISAALHTVPGTPMRQLVTGDRSDLMALVRQEGGWQVGRAGEWWDVHVIDERTRLLREMTGGGNAPTGDQVIKAPMPGLVLRLEVEEGQEVTHGMGLVVLEAMKMENEIRASVAGRVRKVHVVAGQAVEKGAVMLVIGLDHAERPG